MMLASFNIYTNSSLVVLHTQCSLQSYAYLGWMKVDMSLSLVCRPCRLKLVL